MSALSLIFIYFGIVFKIEKRLIYNETGNIDYKVYLKSNDDYNTPFLEKGRKYIASLIDHIDVNYDYNFKADKDMRYVCNYYIMALATIVDSDKKPIYEKEQCLLTKQTKEFTGEEAPLSEKISIDYAQYNEIISDFSSKYLLSGNKNNLKVTMYVELKAQNEEMDSQVVDKSEMYLDIPLTTQTLAVDLSYNEIDNHGEKVEVSTNKTINIISIALGTLLLLISLGYFYIIIANHRKKLRMLSSYDKEKAAIFKKYSDIISNVDDVSSVKTDSLIDVDKFSDLLNIRDCLDKTILFTEIEEENKIALFMVVDNEITYRYTLFDDIRSN